MLKKSELFKMMISELNSAEECIAINEWLDCKVKDIFEKYNLDENEYGWLIDYTGVHKNTTCIGTAIKVSEVLSRFIDVEDDVDLSDAAEVEKLTTDAMENYCGSN